VTSLRLPPVSIRASGTPPPSTSRWCLPARTAPVDRAGTCFRALFCLDVAGVGDRPLPLEPIGGVQLGQQQLVQPLPHPCLLPGRSPRQAVMPQPKPSSCGKCSQPIPVWSTNKIPCNASRSSNGFRPG
jgi:hypothetical protein